MGRGVLRVQICQVPSIGHANTWAISATSFVAVASQHIASIQQLTHTTQRTSYSANTMSYTATEERLAIFQAMQNFCRLISGLTVVACPHHFQAIFLLL